VLSLILNFLKNTDITVFIYLFYCNSATISWGAERSCAERSSWRAERYA